MSARFEQFDVTVDGVRASVLVGGPSDAPQDEAVVFVHGNPGCGSDWRELMAPVSQFVRVVAPTMQGYPGADMRADQDYTVDGYARQLGGIIDELGLRRVHIVAHDFGGPWSLTWAAQNPDVVASVTLINTGVLLGYRWHRLARVWRLPVIGELFMRLSTPRSVRTILASDNPCLASQWITELAASAAPAGTKRAILQLYRSTTPESMARLAETLRPRDTPCLVVFGNNDRYIPAAQAQRQREPFPSAQIEIVEGAGHWVWFERPNRVLELVVPFLQTQLVTASATTRTRAARRSPA